MSTVWRVEVSRENCVATQNCVAALPEVFALGEDGIAVVIGPVDGEDPALIEAVGECPVAALTLIREESAGD